MRLFHVWFWLTVGGALYQAIGPHDWSRAFGTAWDQGSALFAVWLIALVRSKLLFNKRQ